MPQPVDLQTEVGRVTAAERIQAIADRASLAGQQRQITEVEEERVQAETQVQDTAETENRGVDAEGHRKNPFAGRRRRRDAAEKQGGDKELVEDAEEGHQIDITI